MAKPLASMETKGTATEAPGAGGGPDARALYDAEAEFVQRAVARLAGPDSDLQDLVHEVFVIAIRRLSSFEGRSTIRTWLYGIAVRVVAEWRRRRKLRQFLGLSAAPEPVDRTTPADVFEFRERALLVYRILDRMSEKKRAVFILHEMEGLSGEEIAASVGCPVKTVWTRLFHARQDFARALAKLEPVE
jgi:RNA polymerase sigma-70 factor (ECF subfamily)